MLKMRVPRSRALKETWWKARYLERQRTRAPVELISWLLGVSKCIRGRELEGRGEAGEEEGGS